MRSSRGLVEIQFAVGIRVGELQRAMIFLRRFDFGLMGFAGMFCLTIPSLSSHPVFPPQVFVLGIQELLSSAPGMSRLRLSYDYYHVSGIRRTPAPIDRLFSFCTWHWHAEPHILKPYAANCENGDCGRCFSSLMSGARL